MDDDCVNEVRELMQTLGKLESMYLTVKGEVDLTSMYNRRPDHYAAWRAIRDQLRAHGVTSHQMN